MAGVATVYWVRFPPASASDRRTHRCVRAPEAELFHGRIKQELVHDFKEDAVSQPEIVPGVEQFRSAIASLMTRERQAGRAAAARVCYETLETLDRLNRVVGETTPSVSTTAAQKKSWWMWLKNLFGGCTDKDATGASVNQNGDIVEANGNVIQCPAGSHAQCDADNNLWICAQ